MAQTMAAALAAAAGPRFDAAAGYTVTPRRAAPTEPAVAAAFADLDPQELSRLGRGLAARRGCHPTEADDSVQDALLALWSKRPELFCQPAGSWMGLLREVALRRLLEVRPTQPTLSVNALVEQGGDSDLGGAAPCRAETGSAEEESRRARPPARGEPWSREQILGAIQRFRDYHGRPPKAVEFRAINALPSLSALRRHFGLLSDALLTAGMVPATGVARRRSWQPITAARECRAFRRRNSRWPSWRDIGRRPGELPSTSVMIRCFGGTRAIDVQLGAEAILEAVGEPTA